MRQKLKTFLNIHNALLVLAFIITASWVWGTIEAIQKNFTLQQQVDALAQKNAYHELENQTLEFQQKYYQTDEYLELAAREKLNLAAPGEKVLILPPNTVKPSVNDTPEPSIMPLAKRSNFEQWLYFLFGDKK